MPPEWQSQKLVTAVMEAGAVERSSHVPPTGVRKDLYLSKDHTSLEDQKLHF